MSLKELLPSLQALPRPEKLQAIQFLTEKLMEEEALQSSFDPGASYPIWSPYDSYEAADILHKLLDAEKNLP